MVYDPASMFRFAVFHLYSHVLSALTVSRGERGGVTVTTASRSTRFAPPLGQVRTRDEQVDRLGVGVLARERDLFAKVERLVAARLDRDRALDDFDLHRVILEVARGRVGPLDADRVGLVLGVRVGREPDRALAVVVGRDAGIPRVRGVVGGDRDVLSDGAARACRTCSSPRRRHRGRRRSGPP